MTIVYFLAPGLDLGAYINLFLDEMILYTNKYMLRSNNILTGLKKLKPTMTKAFMLTLMANYMSIYCRVNVAPCFL
jgi:hypothetical protein